MINLSIFNSDNVQYERVTYRQLWCGYSALSKALERLRRLIQLAEDKD